MPWITRREYEARQQARFLGGIAFLGVIAIIAGLVAMLILIAAAGFRGAFILAKTFWLYPVIFLAAIVLLVFIIKTLRIPVLNIVLGLAAALVITVFGFKGVTAYYGNSNMHFASIYSADFIQALPDGETPALYEKRNKNGGILAELTVNQKVTVNGISFNKQEYNITTANGVSGWVERSAFPEDAADMLAISIGLDGIDSEEIAVDRQTERLLEKYLEVKDERIVMDVPTKYYGISDAVLRRSTRANAETPVVYVDRKAFKDGAELADAGVKAVLENILYADDCTLLYLSITDTAAESQGSRFWALAATAGSGNTTAWYKSFAVKDLDTGEEWHLMQGDYRRSFRYDKVDGGYKSSIVLFFPPFKSRHFSLTHEASPLPDRNNTGYGGILGWISSMTGQDKHSDFYFDYNFPEVWVR